MTVSSTSNRAVYAGDGTTTTFPFAFKVLQAADLAVVYTDATGTDFPLLASQYAASGFGDDSGGTVTYPITGSPMAAGTTLTLYRSLAPVQSAALSNQGAMWPQVIEGALDRIVMVCQGVIDTTSRALVVSSSDGGTVAPLPTAAARANGVLAFDGAGQPYAARLTGGLVGVSNWLAANFLPMSSAMAARGAIGAAGLADDNAFSGANTFPTQGAADDSTRAATTAFANRAAQNAASALVIRSYLAGLGLSNNVGAPNTKLDVAAGVCADTGNTAMLSLPAGTIDCATVGANGLDASTLANATWYHVFAIGKADGTVARLASTSAASPALPTGYTLKRRIGSFRTDGSAHILAFVQEGDDFLWSTPPALDVNENAPSASAQLRALTVPPDVRVHALINVAVNFPDGVDYLYISSPDTADVAAAGSATPLNNFTSLALSGGTAPGGQLRVRTNTSRQIRYRFSHVTGSNNVKISTLGWSDSRGRNL